MTDIREEVRTTYAAAATRVTGKLIAEIEDAGCCGSTGDAGCCGPSSSGASCGGASTDAGFGSELYDELERSELPTEAVLASLGCGNPTAVADLRAGESVLDLGSGGGIDVLLSAKRVGPSGKVYGLDMTDEMLALALQNREKAGARNVEFLKGFIEQIPLPAETVDVVISNCVINLSADKASVFSEMHRVLTPGGRIGISDIVSSDELTPEDRAERGSYVGCIAGALSFGEYERGLADAGFEEVSIASTHEVAPGIHAAIVKATKPVRVGSVAPV